MSLALFGVPVPAVMLRCYIGGFSVAMLALVSHSAQNVGMALVFIPVLVYCPQWSLLKWFCRPLLLLDVP